MKTIVVITARGGSKGLPGKNIKPLAGKPLIQYTIEAALEVFDAAQIIVSTDSEEIKAVAEQAGIKVPFLRPAELSSDTANSRDVLLHAISWYESNHGAVDVVVLLQPTSPLRTGEQIKEAMTLYHSGLDMVVSAKETDSNPYYVLFEENASGYLEKSKPATFTRRQDAPKVWEYNGAIYCINVGSLKEMAMGEFKKVIPYEMDKMSSVDIDDEIDFSLAELILGRS